MRRNDGKPGRDDEGREVEQRRIGRERDREERRQERKKERGGKEECKREESRRLRKRRKRISRAGAIPSNACTGRCSGGRKRRRSKKAHCSGFGESMARSSRAVSEARLTILGNGVWAWTEGSITGSNEALSS
jgi:hypothetical protein